MTSLNDCLTTKQVATKLAISIPTLYQWIGDGKIPYIRVSRSYLFDPEDLHEWLETNKRKVGA